ncbi:hypothetical protein ACP3P6_01015 [Enterobacter mori]
MTLSGRNVKVTQEVNDAPLPVAFDTLNLSADLHNNRAELGWTIRLTNNGQLDGQVQITDPQGRRNLGGNVNIRNFNLAMVNPIFARGKKPRDCSMPICVWLATRKARNCLVRCGSAGSILTVTLCRSTCSRAR